MPVVTYDVYRSAITGSPHYSLSMNETTETTDATQPLHQPFDALDLSLKYRRGPSQSFGSFNGEEKKLQDQELLQARNQIACQQQQIKQLVFSSDDNQ